MYVILFEMEKTCSDQESSRFCYISRKVFLFQTLLWKKTLFFKLATEFVPLRNVLEPFLPQHHTGTQLTHIARPLSAELV